MKTFTIPNLSADQPMNETGFFKWLIVRPKYDDFFTAFDEYCTSLGWNITDYKIELEQIKICHTIFDYVWQVWPAYNYKFKFSTLFQPVDTKTPTSERFWIYDLNAKFRATPKLQQHIENNFKSLVYGLSPETYYFKITNGNLYIQYQQIIGSRLLCKVFGVPKV